MAIGECSAYSSLRRTRRSSLQPCLWVGGHWCRPTFVQMTQSELVHMAGAVVYSTISSSTLVGLYYILLVFAPGLPVVAYSAHQAP